MRVFGIIALTLAVVLLTAESNHLYYGSTLDSKLLYSTRVVDLCTHYNADKDECLTTFVYPPEGVSNQITIKCIICRENNEGSDTNPKITKGGTGYTYFTVEMRYKPEVKIDYQIKVYCREY